MMIQPPKKNLGLTLVEILIKIGVLAIIATILILGYNFILPRIRDNIRKNDLADIQKALEQYKKDLGCYPSSSNLKGYPDCGSLQLSSVPYIFSRSNLNCGKNTVLKDPSPVSNRIYLAEIPCDPKDKAPFYYYYYSPDPFRNPIEPTPDNYILIACLENPNDAGREKNDDPDQVAPTGHCDGSENAPSKNPNGKSTSFAKRELVN